MVLVTGAAGHLGGALVRELLAQGRKFACSSCRTRTCRA